MTSRIRPSSAIGFRTTIRTTNNIPTVSSPNSNVNNTNGTAESTLLDENGFPLVGHLLAFTPDVIQVFQDAAKSIGESCEIKKQSMNQIRDAFNDAKSYSLTVNQSIAQKLADIITLAVRIRESSLPNNYHYLFQQHLTISLGENMLAQNRAQRWYELTTSAQRSNTGPVSSSNLKTSERLDRPIIRTFQRHPGKQLPEAQMIAKVSRTFFFYSKIIHFFRLQQHFNNQLMKSINN